MEGDVESANFDRPRERLWRRGVASIGDEELLAIVLGTGVRSHPAMAVASELVRASGGVVALSRASPREIAQVLGVGNARAARIAAAFELGRRALETRTIARRCRTRKTSIAASDRGSPGSRRKSSS